MTGDFVLGLILNISSRLDNPRITKDLATAAMLMSEGEILEGKLEESEDATFDDYLKVMEYKTATAFEMAAKLGSIIGNGTEEQIESLAEYGKNNSFIQLSSYLRGHFFREGYSQERVRVLGWGCVRC